MKLINALNKDGKLLFNDQSTWAWKRTQASQFLVDDYLTALHEMGVFIYGVPYHMGPRLYYCEKRTSDDILARDLRQRVSDCYRRKTETYLPSLSSPLCSFDPCSGSQEGQIRYRISVLEEARRQIIESYFQHHNETRDFTCARMIQWLVDGSTFDQEPHLSLKLPVREHILEILEDQRRLSEESRLG